MKKLLSIAFLIFSMFAISAQAEVLDESRIKYKNQIGSLYEAVVEGEGAYLLDSANNVYGGPYEYISNYSDFPYAKRFEGDMVLYDSDGSVLYEEKNGGEVSPPENGIYRISYYENENSTKSMHVYYDYETRKELFRTEGDIYYYLEQQNEKMFIEQDGKYALIDKNGNYVTDYIYDGLKKRFNPDYVPFPKAYAIVVQDGIEKYIDWNLNEIDLDNYNGKPFITNCYRIYTYGGKEYKNYYILESGKKQALYDMATDKIIIDYQSDYDFGQMNDKYIIVGKNNESAVLDHSGNAVVPFSKKTLSLSEDGRIYYHYFDGVSEKEGYIEPETGKIEDKPLEASGYFYKVLGVENREDIASGTIVYQDKAADLTEEDLKGFLDVYWNFRYERVIRPVSSYDTDYYIKLWNKDKTKSYVIYINSAVKVGDFGVPCISHGMEKSNYVWYMPYIGNAKNALYSKNEEIKNKYFNPEYEGYIEKQRSVTEADTNDVEVDNLLSLDGASVWAKPEIQKAAACNLLVYELTQGYTKAITRKEFCDLIYRLIATEFSPDSDSRMGVWSAIDKVIEERGLREKLSGITYTDCEDEKILFLSAADIINGMGNGKFSPDSNLTREQAATILYRTAKFLGIKTIIEPQNKKYYSDENLISDWATNSVKSMREMGIMKGTSEHEFSPQGTYTVEQAIATMLRMYECY